MSFTISIDTTMNHNSDSINGIILYQLPMYRQVLHMSARLVWSVRKNSLRFSLSLATGPFFVFLV